MTSISTNNFIWQFVIELLGTIYGYLVIAMNFMIDKLMKFPLVTNIPEVHEIWWWMVKLSMIFIPLIFVWLSLKKIAGGKNMWDSDLKQTSVRLFYMLGLMILTFPFIDWLIMFNNTLIEALVTRYDIRENINIATMNSPVITDIFAGILIVLQLFFVGKIILGYYFRLLEINFAVIVSPVLYVLWVNQGWSGYIGQWISRMVTLIFSQFIQVLVLVLYSQMFQKFINSGGWDNLFLALAALITTDRIPAVVQHFVAHDNAGQLAMRTITNGARKTYNGYKIAKDPTQAYADWKFGLKNMLSRRRRR